MDGQSNDSYGHKRRQEDYASKLGLLSAMEHFHCTSESNGEYKPNSHFLLSRFSRSYRFKKKLLLSALSVVSWDKEGGRAGQE